MERIYLSNWVIDINAKRTKKYYDTITVEEGCDCAYCRNYLECCEGFQKKF